MEFFTFHPHGFAPCKQSLNLSAQNSNLKWITSTQASEIESEPWHPADLVVWAELWQTLLVGLLTSSLLLFLTN